MILASVLIISKSLEELAMNALYSSVISAQAPRIVKNALKDSIKMKKKEFVNVPSNLPNTIKLV